ncbi:phage tail protein [Halodesulfurarchaeum sp.]|uniref:phage tail protein n=1 Tax=Halodesulfurarchaeum sp. TaxID=1980530 RepID=UPI002FC3B6C8
MKTGRFKVEIETIEIPGFRYIDLPSRSTEQGEYREGNDTNEKKVWGQTTWEDLKMERSLAPGSSELLDWRRAVEAGKADEGRKEIAVVLMNESGEAKIRWEFSNAWITEYGPPELDATADGDVAIESVTVAYDKMDRTEL